MGANAIEFIDCSLWSHKTYAGLRKSEWSERFFYRSCIRGVNAVLSGETILSKGGISVILATSWIVKGTWKEQ